MFHVYLNSVQQMVWKIGRGGSPDRVLKTRFTPQRAPLDTVYALREHLNSVQRMVSGAYCEGLFPDTVSWTRLRNTWVFPSDTKLLRKEFPESFFVFSVIYVGS